MAGKVSTDIIRFLKEEAKQKFSTVDTSKSEVVKRKSSEAGRKEFTVSQKKIRVLREIERRVNQFLQERFKKDLQYYYKVLFSKGVTSRDIWEVFKTVEGVDSDKIYEQVKKIIKEVQSEEDCHFIYFADEVSKSYVERLGNRLIITNFIILSSQIESIKSVIEEVVVFVEKVNREERITVFQSEDVTLGQKLFTRIIEVALKKGASDIHVVPKENAYHVFFRIDGFYVEQLDLLMSEEEGESFLSYTLRRAASEVKGSQFNPDTRLTYQDARISLHEFVKGDIRKIDARIAFIPDGFSLTRMEVVFRLLVAKIEKEDNYQKLSEKDGIYEVAREKMLGLGYLEDDVEVLVEMLFKSRGVVVISGVTNSGKSTLANTLLSCLLHKKVGTVEDPVEYYMKNPNCVQHQLFISEKEGLTMDFERYVKAFKRADYDVIFIGEWRRSKGLTESILEQAYAGQLIFTTLHIGNSFQIFEALKHMYGVKPEELKSVLLLSWNQVLVPKLCDNCKKEVRDYTPSSRVLKKLDYFIYITTRMRARIEEFRADVHYVRGSGCKACSYTGYRGRQVVYDYFVPSLELYEALRETSRGGEEDYSYYRILTTKIPNEKKKSKVDVYMELAKRGIVSMEDICGNEYVPSIF